MSHVLNRTEIMSFQTIRFLCTNQPVVLPPTQTSYREGIGSDRIGSDRIGSDRIGSDRIGSDRIGSDRIGSDRIGSDRMGE